MKSEFVQIDSSIYEYLNPEEKNRASLVANCDTEAHAKILTVSYNNFEELVHILNKITPVLNLCRMLMNSEEARDEAGEMVNNARSLLEKIKKELDD